MAKRLSREGRKTAYVELLPRLQNPLGLFLDQNSSWEKDFFESLGFLFQQKGGFCVLSPEGVWPLQEMKAMKSRQPVLSREGFDDSFKDFKNHWLSCLSFNLAGKVFENNNSEFSDKNLPLFSDYFLFEPSLKRIKQFEADHSRITFYQASLDDLHYEKDKALFFLEKEALPAKEYFFLGEPILEKQKKFFKPSFQWKALFFEVDFGDYKDTIPAHFVSLKNLFFPWTHDNLLSTFHKNRHLEVWMRLPVQQDPKDYLKDVGEHLSTFFPGIHLSSLAKNSPPSLTLYSDKSLDFSSNFKKELYVENLQNFFQADLVSSLQAERDLFNSL